MHKQADVVNTTVAAQRLGRSKLAEMILQDSYRKSNGFEISLRKLSTLRFNASHQNGGPVDNPRYYKFVSDDVRRIIELVDDDANGSVSISTKYLRIDGDGVTKFAHGWSRAQLLIRKD